MMENNKENYLKSFQPRPGHDEMLKERARRKQLREQARLAEEQAKAQAAAKEAEEREREEKLKQEREERMAAFFKQDDVMLLHKFVRIKSPEDYKHRVYDNPKIKTFTGLYILANLTKKKIYVGQGKDVVSRCYAHLRGTLKARDNVPEVREDMLNGDVFAINFVRYKDTSFNTIDELEYHYTHLYDCFVPKGYNHVKPPSTNKRARVSRDYMFEYVENGITVYSQIYRYSNDSKDAALETSRVHKVDVLLFSENNSDRNYYGKVMYNDGKPYYVRGM